MALALGCAHSDFIAVGDKTYPPNSDTADVDVYISTDAPVDLLQAVAGAKAPTDVPSTAKIIGRVDTSGDNYAAWGVLVSDAKKKARALGGDAIAITQWGDWRGAKHFSANVVRFNVVPPSPK